MKNSNLDNNSNCDWEICEFSMDKFEMSTRSDSQKELLLGLFKGVNLIVTFGKEGKTLLAYHFLAEILRSTDLNVVYFDMDNYISLPFDSGLVDFVNTDKYRYRFVYKLSVDFQELALQRKIKNAFEFLNYYLERIRNNLQRIHNSSVVFIDSLQNFVPPANNNLLTRNFFNTIRGYASTKQLIFIILHYTSKVTSWKKKSDTDIIKMSDMVYLVKPLKNTEGIIEGWAMTERKGRFKVPQSMTIIRQNDFSYTIINDAMSYNDISILRDLVQFIRQNMYTNQSIIIENMLKKGHSKARVLEVLNDYKTLFKSFYDKKQNNSKRFYINEQSEYIKLLGLSSQPLPLKEV